MAATAATAGESDCDEQQMPLYMQEKMRICDMARAAVASAMAEIARIRDNMRAQTDEITELRRKLDFIQREHEANKAHIRVLESEKAAALVQAAALRTENADLRLSLIKS